MLINIQIEIDTERDAEELRALMDLIQQLQDKKDVNWFFTNIVAEFSKCINSIRRRDLWLILHTYLIFI